MRKGIELLATLWPSFPHFPQFADDERLSGIRLNSAMINNPELATELKTIKAHPVSVPLYFDIKGRQLRVTEWHENDDHLDISINHPIDVPTPLTVFFKAGADKAFLERIEEGGTRLIFRGGPRYKVGPGESLQIRHPGLQVFGDTFTKVELEKIDQVRRAGFTRYFLSYVEDQRDVDQLLELVGRNSEVMIKIENKKGLQFANRFRKRPNLRLVAARGDLYVELDKPHHMMDALKLIISKDPEACVGSRIFLSVVRGDVPECADFLELAWLYDIGYRSMMLCDEICLKEDLLDVAVDAFDEFRNAYAFRASSTDNRRSWLRKILQW